MPEVKDSVRGILVLMFLLFSGNVSTGFPVDSYGDIIWEEVPDKAPMDGAATEGKLPIGCDGWPGSGFLPYFLRRLFNFFRLVVQQYPKLVIVIINVSFGLPPGVID